MSASTVTLLIEYSPSAVRSIRARVTGAIQKLKSSTLTPTKPSVTHSQLRFNRPAVDPTSIRLRSSELDQHEVAYYFASLALGLLAGLGAGMGWITPLLMAAILGTLYVGDHPALLPRYRRRNLILDTAITDDRDLVPYLEQQLGAKVHRVRVKKVDFVNETTSVEVRFELPREESATSDVLAQLEADVGSER